MPKHGFHRTSNLEFSYTDSLVRTLAYLGYPPNIGTQFQLNTVMLRYNAVVGRHLLGPPYKRGALWDPVDLFDIIIPRQRTGQVQSVPSSVANA